MTTDSAPALLASTPVVKLSSEGQVLTTSPDVAAFFQKRHADVLRAIERLMVDLAEHAEVDPELNDQGERDAADHKRKSAFMLTTDFFQPIEVEVGAGNGAIRRDRAYALTRDGFSLLAMGFTGRQALAFKLAYIAAFNLMEAKLRDVYVAPLPSDKEFSRGIRIRDKLVLHEQAREASRALTDARTVREKNQAYWQLYQLNTALGVPMPSMRHLGITPLALSDQSMDH